MSEGIKIQVRFSDIDVMGHVNNSVYLSYFEYARVQYFAKLLGTNWDWKKNGVLLVRNEVDYHRPVLLTDFPEVFIFVDTVGSKSFTLSYEVKVKGVITTTGKSVLVSFDSNQNSSIEVPTEMRNILLAMKKE